MEPHLKRMRLSGNTDKGIDLQRRQRQNDSRLKSMFESIFEKYEKDFEGIGDEIDIRTGHIVVDNGHILGMTDEKDAGDTGSSSDELESGYYSEDYDTKTPVEHDGLRDGGQVSAFLVHRDLMAEPDVSWRSDDDADSLMGAIEGEHPSIEEDAIPSGNCAVSDSEEDELANNQVKWMTPRHFSAVAESRWHRRKQEIEPVDDSVIEPAWRAPLINKVRPSSQGGPNTRPTCNDDLHDNPDSGGEGVSLWAPERKRLRRRKSRNSYPLASQGLLDKREQCHTKVRPSHSSAPGQASRQRLWTQEEEKLLRKLKATTTLTCRELRPYFAYRSEQSIAYHWHVMRHRALANPECTPSARLGSKSNLPLTASYQLHKSRNRIDSDYSARDSAQRTSVSPKAIEPAVKDQTVDTEKLPTEPIDECLLQPEGRTQEAIVSDGLAEIQSMLNIVERPPKIAQGQHEGIVIADTISEPGAFCTGNPDSLLNLPIVQETSRSADPMVLNIPNRQYECVVPHIRNDSSEGDSQTEAFIWESQRVKETAVAALRGLREYGKLTGRTRQMRTGSRKPRLSNIATHRSFEDDAKIRRQKCAHNLTSEGSDVISQYDNRGRERKEGHSIRDDLKLSHIFEDPTDEAPLSLQTVSAVMPEVCFPLQNPASTPGPVIEEILKSPLVKQATRKEPFLVRRATSAEIDLIPERLEETTVKPATTEHVIQVLVPFIKPNSVSRGPKIPFDFETDERKANLGVQSSEDQIYKTRKAEQSPSERSSCAVDEGQSTVPIRQSHVDKINTRNGQHDQLQCDAEDLLGLDISFSQPLSISATISRKPKSQEKLAKRLAPIGPQSSGREFPLVSRSPRMQKTSKSKNCTIDSLSSISEAMLDCSEDELSYM